MVLTVEVVLWLLINMPWHNTVCVTKRKGDLNDDTDVSKPYSRASTSYGRNIEAVLLQDNSSNKVAGDNHGTNNNQPGSELKDWQRVILKVSMMSSYLRPLFVSVLTISFDLLVHAGRLG